jgi:aminopeptidase-like protein
MRKINTGFVVTTIGGPGKYGYKQSWQRDHFINKVTEETFKENNIDYIKYPFDIHGSDERQYSSQGFRINTVSITKDKSYEYPYYHTSLDNLDFVKPEYIQESLHLYLCVIEKLEKFRVSYDYAQPDGIRFSGQGEVYENLYPFCEVMLSKHGLLSGVGGSQLPVNGVIEELDIILWLLFYCDGKMSLNDISHKTGIPLVSLQHVALKLKDKCLLRKNVKKGIHCDSGV